MPKNCLEEYLTTACAKCTFWSDGTKEPCIGCCAPFPIMECEAFAKMYNEEEQKRERQIISRLERKIIFYTHVEYTASFPIGARRKTISGQMYLPNTLKYEGFAYEIQTEILRTWRVQRDSIIVLYKEKETSYKDLEGKLCDYEFSLRDGTKKISTAKSLIEAYYWAGMDEAYLDIVDRIIIQEHKEVK